MNSDVKKQSTLKDSGAVSNILGETPKAAETRDAAKDNDNKEAGANVIVISTGAGTNVSNIVSNVSDAQEIVSSDSQVIIKSEAPIKPEMGESPAGAATINSQEKIVTQVLNKRASKQWPKYFMAAGLGGAVIALLYKYFTGADGKKHEEDNRFVYFDQAQVQ